MTQSSTSTPLQRAYARALQEVLQLWLRERGLITRRYKGTTTKFFFPVSGDPYLIINFSKTCDHADASEQPLLTGEVLQEFIEGSTAFIDSLEASGEHDLMLSALARVSHPLEELFTVVNGSPLTAHLKLRAELLADTGEVDEWENPLKSDRRGTPAPSTLPPHFAATQTLPPLPPLPQF